MKRLGIMMLAILTFISSISFSTGNNSSTASKKTVLSVSDESKIFKKYEFPYTDKPKNISDIINEETAYFFAGDHTAKQCADMIQNRVSIMLSEQTYQIQ